MNDNFKRIDSLQVADLQAYCVWQYINRDERDETLVRPVKNVPVAKLAGRVVGAEVTLSNGRRVWALVGNVDPMNPRLTEHFVTLSVERDGRWFTLARYHDFDYATRGPEALASFLGLPIHDVFPIAYDLRPFAKGLDSALSREIDREPRERLSRAEIIAMAVP